MILTTKQLKTLRLKKVAYELAAAHIRRAIDSTDWDESGENLSNADVKNVTRTLKRIAIDLSRKASEFDVETHL